MPRLPLLAALALPLGLAACAAGDRGMISPHQPVVDARGAYVPGCPDWRDHGWTFSEGQASNYGCATAVNLAAMVADPGDLIHGKRGDGAGMAELAVRAIKAQRDLGPSGKSNIDKTSSKAGS